MAKIPLFGNWTWKLSLPEPFDKVTNIVSTTYYSIYCTVTTKKATLHGPALSAILAYLDMDTSLPLLLPLRVPSARRVTKPWQNTEAVPTKSMW